MAPIMAAFSEAVHRERLDRARAVLRAAGFDGAVSVAPEHHYYFAGYDAWVGVNSPQALVFAAGGGEPVLVLRDVDRPLARETTWVSDVRTYRLHRDDPAGLIAEVARELGIGSGRVAVETRSYALPLAMGNTLADALAPVEIADGTELLGDLRVVKSEAELAYLRRAGTHARAGLEAARRSLRPGMSEIALAAEVEAAVRGSGSDYWAIPMELASGARGAGGHGTPRERIVEPGDLVHLEFAGVARRYHAVAIQTLAAGRPAAREAELYEIARRSLAAGIAAVAPGVPGAAIEEASLEPLVREGLERHAMMRFGYGVGIAYPPIWLETLEIGRGSDRRLEPGMVFVLHACLELEEEGLGVVIGGTYALGPQGLEMLAGAGAVALC